MPLPPPLPPLGSLAAWLRAVAATRGRGLLLLCCCVIGVPACGEAHGLQQLAAHPACREGRAFEADALVSIRGGWAQHGDRPAHAYGGNGCLWLERSSAPPLLPLAVCTPNTTPNMCRSSGCLRGARQGTAAPLTAASRFPWAVQDAVGVGVAGSDQHSCKPSRQAGLGHPAAPPPPPHLSSQIASPAWTGSAPRASAAAARVSAVTSCFNRQAPATAREAGRQPRQAPATAREAAQQLPQAPATACEAGRQPWQAPATARDVSRQVRQAPATAREAGRQVRQALSQQPEAAATFERIRSREKFIGLPIGVSQRSVGRLGAGRTAAAVAAGRRPPRRSSPLLVARPTARVAPQRGARPSPDSFPLPGKGHFSSCRAHLHSWRWGHHVYASRLQQG